MTDWLDPLNKLLFQGAFKAGAKKVKLRDGREFHLSYEDSPDGPVVLVRPMRGFIPMGRFLLDIAMSDLWLQQNDKSPAKEGTFGAVTVTDEASLFRREGQKR